MLFDKESDKMIKSEILNKIFESGASTTKSITVFGVIFGALVLAYAVYSNLPDVGYMFAVFMITTCGLTTTKGLVDIAKAKIEVTKKDDE